MDELENLGVKLVMVSIGKPEIGKELIQHLEFQNGENYLYVGKLCKKLNNKHANDQFLY